MLTYLLPTHLPITGRQTTRIGPNDGGGSAAIDYVTNNDGGVDAFIPVNIDRTAADSVAGGCTTLCFPRTMTLEIGYHQRSKRLKRIIFANLIYEDFDKNSTRVDYKLKTGKLKEQTDFYLPTYL